MAPPVQGTPQVQIVSGTAAEFNGNLNSWLQDNSETNKVSVIDIQYTTLTNTEDPPVTTFYAFIFYTQGIPVV
jgi:hypothetical protein